ncbi:hypothetical protein TNIN_77741 [Trichonephila inaurata madagascariensis]|uniref:Uncharacterized protein n=1 Tax=Trichonephila inaurata madagascariensis TaxID=2747483 RepID=A0A8X7BPR2_9ARAC|nr:hypothetical protein TNIN_77741 [Trichonephila inaurata madagascariensis]
MNNICKKEKADQNHRVLEQLPPFHIPPALLRYSVEEKPMRYLNDQPMRCSLLWQRDPVNRSRGDDLPIILSDAEERDEEGEKVIINEVVFLVESCDF